MEASRMQHLIKYSGVKALLFYIRCFALRDGNTLVRKAKFFVQVLCKMEVFNRVFIQGTSFLIIKTIINNT